MIITSQFIFNNSSALKSIEHDGIALASVRFVSNPENIYQYYPVTGAQVARIARAHSHGKMLHEEILNNKAVTMIRKISDK